MELTREQKLEAYRRLAFREPSEQELSTKRTAPEFYLGFSGEIKANFIDPLNTLRTDLALTNTALEELRLRFSDLEKVNADLRVLTDRLISEKTTLTKTVETLQADNTTLKAEVEKLKNQSIEAISGIELVVLGLRKLFQRS